MAVRIAEYVYSGELRNTNRNRVFGWIEFAPDYGIFLEMAGNFSGDLAGKHIRFRRSPNIGTLTLEPGSFPDFVEGLANRQIGVVERVELRRAGAPTIPLEEFSRLSAEEQQRHIVERDSLVLEWWSQNGHVICELDEPEWQMVDDDDRENRRGDNGMDENLGFLPEAMGDISIAYRSGQLEAYSDFDEYGEEDDEDEGEDDGEDDDDDQDEGDDDPYGLFDDNLRDAVEQSLGQELSDTDDELVDFPVDGERTPKSWDEVIPGIDPETKQLYEQWDEIVEGKKDEPISYLFPTLMKLPQPDQVQSEAEAEVLVKQILAQLALLSVAIDICEHYTMQATYRLLVENLLPEAKVHPNLAASEMVQHYSTSDHCSQCESEIFGEESN